MNIEFITLDQASEILNRGKSRIYHFIQDGTLTPYKSIDGTFLDRAEVEALKIPRAIIKPSGCNG